MLVKFQNLWKPNTVIISSRDLAKLLSTSLAVYISYNEIYWNMTLTDQEKIKAIEKVLDNQLLAYYVIIQEIKDILEKWKNQLKNLYD